MDRGGTLGTWQIQARYGKPAISTIGKVTTICAITGR